MITGRASDEEHIRSLIDERAHATQIRDLSASLTHIALGVVLFDVVDPLRSVGFEALAARASAWRSSFEGPIGFEQQDLSIAVGDDVAFSHSLNHVKATKPDGDDVDIWWRSTVCYRKLDGKWMVVHEHNSVPFNPESGRASTDLQPRPRYDASAASDSQP